VQHGGILETLLRAFGLTTPALRPCAADLNCDNKVGLADLSIFLYFAPRPAPNPVDLNKDGVVDTKDFSMLFSSWTEKLLTFVPDSVPSRAELRFETKRKDQLAFVGQAKVSGETGVPQEKLKEVGGIKKIGFLSEAKKIVSGTISFLRGLFVKAVDRASGFFGKVKLFR